MESSPFRRVVSRASGSGKHGRLSEPEQCRPPGFEAKRTPSYTRAEGGRRASQYALHISRLGPGRAADESPRDRASARLISRFLRSNPQLRERLEPWLHVDR